MALAIILSVGVCGNGYAAAQASDTVSVEVITDKTVSDSSEVSFPIVKREVSASDQAKIGTTIMVFIIVVMTLVNNYNPD